MKPTLPQGAPDGPLRAAALDAARSAYRYSYTYPPGAAWAEAVPKGDGYSLFYVADYVKIEATLRANHVAARLGGLEEFSPERHAAERSSLSPDKLGEQLFHIGSAIAARMQRTRFSSVDDFARFFGTIERPRSLRLFQGTAREQDLLFAWQRLAGANPLVIEGLDALPERMPVTAAHFDAAMGAAGVSGDSLEAALAEGRLFVADYRHFDGLPAGRNGETPKYLYAPIALFVRPTSGGAALLPVAIQCGQTAGDAFPIWTPADGWRWRMARTIVQIADGNDHETRQHLGRTHGVMEAVTIACMRSLPPMHPLHALLTPHFETTLQINESAKTSLIAPDGGVDHVLAGTLETSVKLTAIGLSTPIDLAGPVSDFATRKVADTTRLPVYPYRDDGLEIWGAIRRFVGAYVALYYPNDEAVIGDTELLAFVTELGADDGGRLRSVPRPATREQLTELLATFLYTASAQHSALNYAQFEFMGMIPNMPGAAYAEAPTRATSDEEASLAALLPPVDVATEHFTLAYELSGIRRNHLGEYPLLYWKDRDAKTIADQFAKNLADLELLLGARDGSRLLPYPYMRPSMIAASIHI